jgi:hypothetical protein
VIRNHDDRNITIVTLETRDARGRFSDSDIYTQITYSTYVVYTLTIEIISYKNQNRVFRELVLHHYPFDRFFLSIRTHAGSTKNGASFGKFLLLEKMSQINRLTVSLPVPPPSSR